MPSPRLFTPAEAAKRGHPVLLRKLAGSRLVDLPIRVYALILIVTILTSPTSRQSGEIWYVMLHMSMVLLIALAPFFPLCAGLSAAGGYVLFAVLYPDFLDPFDTPLVLATAALLATWRWRSWLLLSAIHLLLTLLSNFIQPMLGIPLHFFFYQWAMASALAFSGALLERRVHRETEARVAGAVAHERESQSLRVSLYTEMHDTVSHSLTTQAAISRLLASRVRDGEDGEQHQLVTRLLLENDNARWQLREALAKISDSNRQMDEQTVASTEIDVLAEGLEATAQASGFGLEIGIGDLPDRIPAELFRDAAQSLRELVTNILRHATDPLCCSVVISHKEGPNRALLLVGVNVADTDLPAQPASLTARAGRRGGSVAVDHDGHTVRVSVTLPWVPNIICSDDAQASSAQVKSES